MAANRAPASANKRTAAIAVSVATPSKPSSNAPADSTHESRDNQSISMKQQREANVPVLNCDYRFPAHEIRVGLAVQCRLSVGGFAPGDEDAPSQRLSSERR
jgi:hypothetical protein